VERCYRRRRKEHKNVKKSKSDKKLQKAMAEEQKQEL